MVELHTGGQGVGLDDVEDVVDGGGDAVAPVAGDGEPRRAGMGGLAVDEERAAVLAVLRPGLQVLALGLLDGPGHVVAVGPEHGFMVLEAHVVDPVVGPYAVLLVVFPGHDGDVVFHLMGPEYGLHALGHVARLVADAEDHVLAEVDVAAGDADPAREVAGLVRHDEQAVLLLPVLAVEFVVELVVDPVVLAETETLGNKAQVDTVPPAECQLNHIGNVHAGGEFIITNAYILDDAVALDAQASPVAGHGIVDIAVLRWHTLGEQLNTAV